MVGFVKSTVTLCLLAAVPWASALRRGLNGPKMSIGQMKRDTEERALRKRDVDPSLLYTAYNFTMPVDHFFNESQYEPHTNATFNNRYWFDATYYKPGGPVIILQSGEDDGTDRLPFLQKGIVYQLAKATNGLGVIFEHRYYGASFPTPDLSVENLRFLTTQQALADEAYFARNIVFPGLEQYDLTSKSTAWIGYGGSYAGAFVALLRVIYPDIFWGTISSSGVTKAIYDYWEYFAPIVEYGPPKAIHLLRTLTHIVDNIVIGKANNTQLTTTLKTAFGLQNLTYVQDFTNALSSTTGYWQSLNWDPAVSDPTIWYYFGNISSPDLLFNSSSSLRQTVEYLIQEGGYECTPSLVTAFLNYIGWINEYVVEPCVGETQDECLSYVDATYYTETDYDAGNSWRSWSYQYCTEWGYLQTGSGWPNTSLPLISRTIDLEYESIVCRDAFNITKPSNTEAINKYGGYDISYDRLAIIGGEWDPWRPATPLAFGYGAKNRTSTVDEPFILISKAVHHWDENGLFPNETTATLPPASIVQAQTAEAEFVQEWMAEWNQYCDIVGGCS